MTAHLNSGSYIDDSMYGGNSMLDVLDSLSFCILYSLSMVFCVLMTIFRRKILISTGLAQVMFK